MPDRRVIAHFSDMLEDVELHVGDGPAMINNQMDLRFTGVEFVRQLQAKAANAYHLET